MFACIGVVDKIQIELMLPGRTKFAADLVARHVAKQYDRADTLNHAQLLNHAHPYATANGYDDYLLETWKVGSSLYFKSMAHILSYRSLMLIADDGKIDFGAQIQMSEHLEACPDRGPFI